MGSLHLLCFSTEALLVIPLTFSPKSSRAYLFPNPAKFITFAAAPLVLTPFVRSQLPECPLKSQGARCFGAVSDRWRWEGSLSLVCHYWSLAWKRGAAKGERAKAYGQVTEKLLRGDLNVILTWLHGWTPFCGSPFSDQWVSGSCCITMMFCCSEQLQRRRKEHQRNECRCTMVCKMCFKYGQEFLRRALGFESVWVAVRVERRSVPLRPIHKLRLGCFAY